MPKRSRLTKKKLNYLIKEEKEAVKEYRKLGFPALARDEAKHAKFLKTKLKCV